MSTYQFKSVAKLCSAMLLLSLTAYSQTYRKTPASSKIKKSAKFNVEMNSPNKIDTMTISIYKYTLINNSGSGATSEPSILKSSIDKNGTCTFIIPPMLEPYYISLSYGTDSSSSIRKAQLDLLNLYLVEPGDNITLQVIKDNYYEKFINRIGTEINDPYFSYIYKNKEYSIAFSGLGSEKYTCRYQYDRSCSAYNKIKVGVLDKNGQLTNDLHIDAMKNKSLGILNHSKRSIRPLAYSILYADILGKYNGDWYRSFSFKWYDWKNSLNEQQTDFATKARSVFFDKSQEEIEPLSEEVKRLSAWFPYWIIQYQVAQERLQNESASARGDGVFNRISINFKGEVRDKIVANYLLDWHIYLDNGAAILRKAAGITSTPYYAAKIEQLIDLQTKGKEAFNFSLTDTENKVITLGSLRGKVVLIDFWYTACSNCIDYYQSVLTDVEDHYRSDDRIRFVSVNIDLLKDTWLKSVASGKYTSSRAINLNTGGAGANHQVINHYQVTGYPRPILIDRYGKIFSASASDLRNKTKLKLLIEQALNN